LFLVEGSMKDLVQEISFWLHETVKRLSLPLQVKTFKKKINDVQLGIQLYRSRHNGNFCVEFKIYNEAVASFGETGRTNSPIFDQRLYRIQPIIGEKSPGDFWMAPDDRSQIDQLKLRIIEQGESVFPHLCSLAALLTFYEGTSKDVYIADWRTHKADANMWAPKIKGHLSGLR
jgi:hypothetical protein